MILNQFCLIYSVAKMGLSIFDNLWKQKVSIFDNLHYLILNTDRKTIQWDDDSTPVSHSPTILLALWLRGIRSQSCQQRRSSGALLLVPLTIVFPASGVPLLIKLTNKAFININLKLSCFLTSLAPNIPHYKLLCPHCHRIYFAFLLYVQLQVSLHYSKNLIYFFQQNEAILAVEFRPPM